jgi:hypothetical protein
MALSLTFAGAARMVAVRSLHRSNIGSSTVAGLISLLGVILIVRLGANLFVAWDVRDRGGVVDLSQFSFWHALLIYAAAVWSGAPRGCVARRAVSAPFLADSPRAARFARRVVIASIARPALIVPLTVATMLCILCARGAASYYVAAALLLPLGLVTSLGVQRVLRLLDTSPDNARVIQLIGTLIIVSLNPDVGAGERGMVTKAFLTELPQPGVLLAASLLSGVFAIPVIAGAVISLGARTTQRLSKRSVRAPMLRLYGHLAAGVMAGCYAAIIPGLISTGIRALGIGVYLVGFCGAGILFGISSMARADLAFQRWSTASLAWPSCRRLLIGPAILHLLLLMPGILGLAIRLRLS